MADYIIQGETLNGIANAIRAKTGSSDSINPENMASAINGIQTGNSVVVGEATRADDMNIVISDAIGKDNVALMIMGSTDYHGGVSPVLSVVIHGDNIYYCIDFLGEIYNSSNDGTFVYDKLTGTISLTTSISHEGFSTENYMYIAW